MEWVRLMAAQPLFGVCLTVAAYAVAESLWRGTGRPVLLNPVLVATAALASVLVALDIPYAAYLAQAEPIDEMLALLVVLLAVPLCRQFPLLREAGQPAAVALVAGSVIALGTALLLPLMSGLDPVLIATLAPKSTMAIAVGVTERLGGVPGLTAVTVIATGMFGAAFGPGVLALAGVTDHRAVGFAMGVSSHAIGTARAFQISDLAGAFASLGMILNALLTMALVPLVLAAL